MASSRMVAGVIALVTMASAVLFGCAGPERRHTMQGTYEGPPAKVGAGMAWTFVILDGEGKPSALGIKMNDAALSNLPTTHPYDTAGVEYRVYLPKEAAVAGYDHVTVNWNPQGHIPPGVYDSQHFDFHFYLITPEERYKITLEGEGRARAQKQPEPQFMPEDYILPEGTAEPRMGAHAIDPSAPEFNHQSFSRTFIYGFNDGRMIFVEPMVSKAFFDTRKDVTENIKTPQAYQQHAYYPTQYRVGYDSTKKEYVIALEGLRYH